MHELGLLWRVRKQDDAMEARLAWEDVRGHVVVLYCNGCIVSSEAFEDSAMRALEVADQHRRNLLGCGWTQQLRERLIDSYAA